MDEKYRVSIAKNEKSVIYMDKTKIESDVNWDRQSESNSLFSLLAQLETPCQYTLLTINISTLYVSKNYKGEDKLKIFTLRW